MEEILARFFLSLKHKAEVIHKTYFRRCVIGVGQGLNRLQRSCIMDGAVICGFEAIQIVNDTNAVAATLMTVKVKKMVVMILAWIGLR